MKKDSAIDTIYAASKPYQGRQDTVQPLVTSREEAASWIGVFVSLGMLKLEEPPSVEGLIAEANHYVRHGGFVEVSPYEVSRLVDLVTRLSRALAAK